MAASARTTFRQSSNGPGNLSRQIRMSPKTAAFEISPDSTADTSGDDSRYASGSQPWSGKSGALTAKATRKPRKTHVLVLVPVETRSNEPSDSPNTITEASISSDPAIV